MLTLHLAPWGAAPTWEGRLHPGVNKSNYSRCHLTWRCKHFFKGCLFLLLHQLHRGNMERSPIDLKVALYKRLGAMTVTSFTFHVHSAKENPFTHSWWIHLSCKSEKFGDFQPVKVVSRLQFNQETTSGLASVAILGASLLKPGVAQTPCTFILTPSDFELLGPSRLFAQLRLVNSDDLLSPCEIISELRLPFLCSLLSQPVVPIILFNLRALAYLSKPSENGRVYSCVCFADLRLWHEGRGLCLCAVSTGEVLQREVRNLSTAQRLQRPLQGYGPCSGNPGERCGVRTLFTWVSKADATLTRWASEPPLRFESSWLFLRKYLSDVHVMVFL